HQAPVPLAADFAFEEPARGPGDLQFAAARAAEGESIEREGGIPDGREAGLDAEGVVLLDHEIIELLEGPAHLGGGVGIAEGGKGNDRVDDGWEDGADAVGVLEVVEHPARRLLDGAAAEPLRAPLFEELDDVVDAEKDVGRGEQALARPAGGQTLERRLDE